MISRTPGRQGGHPHPLRSQLMLSREQTESELPIPREGSSGSSRVTWLLRTRHLCQDRGYSDPAGGSQGPRWLAWLEAQLPEEAGVRTGRLCACSYVLVLRRKEFKEEGRVVVLLCRTFIIVYGNHS